MESPLYQRWAKLEDRLDLKIDSLALLRENRTCWIYRADVAGEGVVIKQYKHHARALCDREAVALSTFAEVSRTLSGLLTSEVRRLNRTTGTLCVTFLEGDLMSERLRRSGRIRAEQARCCIALQRVGELLRRVRQRTLSPAPPAPFLEEYLVHTSRQLESLPAVGALFAGHVASAQRLYEELRDAADPTSLAHGDLVCANLILEGDRIGVIDFANANPESHPLDDVYNLQVTCENLLHLPRSFRRSLGEALASSLELEPVDERTRRFFWEYHKRRWLHLQLSGGWSRRVRALALLPGLLRTEARPKSLDGASVKPL